jgi:hypothetical protein
VRQNPTGSLLQEGVAEEFSHKTAIFFIKYRESAEKLPPLPIRPLQEGVCRSVCQERQIPNKKVPEYFTLFF